MPLQQFKKDAIERIVRKLEPNAVTVSLTSGLYATVTLRNGHVITIPEYTIRDHTLEDKLTWKDFHR